MTIEWERDELFGQDFFIFIFYACESIACVRINYKSGRAGKTRNIIFSYIR